MPTGVFHLINLKSGLSYKLFKELTLYFVLSAYLKTLLYQVYCYIVISKN